MRSKKSFLNAMTSIIMEILSVFLAFIGRSVFIHILGEEYLGVSGLFTNILTLLSMADMGFGTAIVFAMYKPMAEGDEEKLNALLKLYAKIYTVVGICVITVGLLITPCLQFFISGVDSVEHIRLIYAMYVLNTGLSYFFVYKSSIINVSQDGYIVTINKFVFKAFQQIAQIVFLLITHNFLIYCGIMVIFTLLGNISISQIANKKFPYILKNTDTKVTKEELKLIKKNCGAMIFHKVGDVVVNGTDNLLIAKFVGVIEVGLYSNYSMIISNVLVMVNQVFSSIIASVGNFAVEGDSNNSKKLFKNIFFINCVIGGFCSACLFNLLNPFVRVWVGDKYLLDITTVFLIVAVFYMQVVRQTALTFKSAYGLFWNDRYKPLVEAIVNLTVSISLGKIFGIHGVFIGTLVSIVGVCFWVEPYIVYKYVFKESVIPYLCMFAKYTIINFAGILLGHIVIERLMASGIIGIIVDLTITIFLWGMIFIIFFIRTSEFKWLRTRLLLLIKNRTRK